VLRKVLLVVLALILLALPLAIRWLYYFEGWYKPREVPRPDLAGIQLPVPEMEPFADRYTVSTPGTVLIDRAHGNRFEMGELNVLQSRLAARGQRLEPVETADDLAQQFQDARALVIISPGQDWTPSEIQQVQQFVDKGGRLLLVTDPTRFEVILDELGNYVGLDYDVAHINDLAARFGLVFQADYLYNTVDNEGNFRNIKLTDMVDEELTRGLDQVVFYAAHSILSDQAALIAASGDTRSSSSERAGALGVAVLAGGGQVLALGDLTFMTEPYNAAYDNDRLISNIADFLSTGQRQYTLADFPFFFGDKVDLVYAGDPLLDSDFLSSGSNLQALLDDEGKELTVRQSEDKARDTFFIGLYQSVKEVEPYLEAAQVTVWITPTTTAEKGAQAVPLSPTIPLARSAVTRPLTTTSAMTPQVSITTTPKAETEIAVTAAITPTAESRVEIESLGEMILTGTSLLILESDGERHVLMVLADTQPGLEKAIQRLGEGTLEGCLLRETETPTPTTVALCPTGEVAPGSGGGGWKEPELQPTPPPSPVMPPTTVPVTPTVVPPPLPGAPQGSILIIAMDKGQGQYDSLTGADDFATILKDRYQVGVWSVAKDGLPAATEFSNYDLVIWAAGDFQDAFGEAESSLVLALAIEGMPMIVSGAYVGDSKEQAVQRDIKVSDALHPIANGFSAEEVIAFVPAPSGSEYETNLMQQIGPEESTVVFVRGPDSEKPGAPSIVSLGGRSSGMRVVSMGFPIYLLPEEAKARLVLNTVQWLLAAGA
jgi:hypothetical protein